MRDRILRRPDLSGTRWKKDLWTAALEAVPRSGPFVRNLVEHGEGNAETQRRGGAEREKPKLSGLTLLAGSIHWAETAVPFKGFYSLRLRVSASLRLLPDPSALKLLKGRPERGPKCPNFSGLSLGHKPHHQRSPAVI